MRASWKCFYCSNIVNRHGRHVLAWIRHVYKAGHRRESERRFHVECFEKFGEFGGRPYNPHTHYETIGSSIVEAD